MLLVGFVAALRRSELAALTVEDLAEHPNGLLISIPRSKTNLVGDQAELVVLPRGSSQPHRSPTAIDAWLHTAEITTGPIFRPVSKGNRALSRPLNPESINTLIQAAVARADLDPLPYSAHSLRAGFVTYAHLRGASDRAIATRACPVERTGVGTLARGLLRRATTPPDPSPAERPPRRRSAEAHRRSDPSPRHRDSPATTGGLLDSRWHIDTVATGRQLIERAPCPTLVVRGLGRPPD